MDFKNNINLSQNELQNAALQKLSAAPTTPAPVKGQMYYNTVSNRAFICTNPVGPVWVAMDAADAPSETTATLGTIIGGATNKTPPIDADLIPLADSTASNILRKLTWANVKATLKTYFDTLYSLAAHVHPASSITSGTLPTVRGGTGVSIATTDLLVKSLGVPTNSSVQSVVGGLWTFSFNNDGFVPRIGMVFPLTFTGYDFVPTDTVMLETYGPYTITRSYGAGTPININDIFNGNTVLVRFTGTNLQLLTPSATSSNNGYMHKMDKFSLDRLLTAMADIDSVATSTILGRKTSETGAPEALVAADVRAIITDSSNRFVTDTDKSNWNGKVPSTRTVNGNALSADITLDPDDLDDTSTSHKFVALGDLTKLANLSNTNSGDETASGILSKLLTVDGDTSGLDADLFRGNTPAAFATAAQGTLANNAVPNTRKVNNKALSADISITASDVGLGNVTDHPQVRKLASSTAGNVPTWGDGNGNVLGTGYTVETSLTGGSGALPRADAVKTYIDALLGANDAMIFKGTVGGGTDGAGNLTIATFNALAVYNSGWSYKVIAAGTIKGIVCEIGDLLVATVDRGSAGVNADWIVLQTNTDGAVTGPGSATSGNFPVFNGTSGKVIQNSAYNPSSFALAGHNHDTVYPKKYTVAIGGATSVVVTHNLNTRALTYSIFETASPWAAVITDVALTTLDTLTVSFAVAPAAGFYTITVIG